MTEGEDIVISGIGGKFPESDTVLELQQKLFAKEDFVTNEMRWTTDTIGVGKIKQIDTFDAYPFKMHSKLIRSCDPTTTQTLERAFEALIDAGMNPFRMGNRNIGVISASMLSDSENTRAGTSYEASGLTIMGHNRSMVANRISFTFNFTGPSFSLHTSWCGGMTALEQGAKLIREGFCEAVIVTTASLIFYKAGNLEYADLHLLAHGNRCKSFDADANGGCRSEGVVSFFLQKAKDAKRNYATVVTVTSDCLGLRACSLINFDNLLSERLLNFYKNNNIDPDEIAYLEADGSGFKKFDCLELNSLAKVFARRKKPLAIGSVKSNVGNTDASSSFLGITKSIIAMETGLIPPNIHYSKPNPEIPALVNGQFQPVTEATELSGDLVAVSTLSIGGSYGHVILKRNTKQKQKLAPGQLPPDGLPRIIMLSARHESGAKAISEQVQSMPVDPEFTSMVNDVFQSSLPGYLWKSYAIVPSAEIKYNIKNSDNVKQPIWFVFSGMGSQFLKMGKDLLQIPLFATAVAKCDAVLRPRGVDIYHIITADDPLIFENILNCFVGIAAVQIGLVDILKAIGLEPDGMVGHSVGELGCSYADGCFTAEEMVLAAYARGKASLDSEVIEGMMAAVGLGYQEMKTRVPPTLDVACHNASDSCTLSGPTEDVLEYVKQLKDEKVFAKAVSAGNIAYHSRYIQPIAPKLLQYLQELIKDPKPRSAKWVSSSVPEADWSSPLAKHSSAEYHTNNLLSSVLFEEASRHIPKNAVVIEIAPHGLLQAILRRSLAGCVNIPLTNRNAKNGVEFLLEALGSLYLNNVSFDVNKLYPAVEYPVSRGTPYLAPLITYDHHDTWFSEFETILQLMSQKSRDIEVDLGESNTEYNLWMEHKIENQAVLPSTQAFVCIWKLFFGSIGMDYEKETVLIEDVVISKQIVLNPCDQKLVMTVRKGTNNFGVMLKEREESDTYLTGKINQIPSPEIHLPSSEEEEEKEEVEVNQDEILSVLSQFGYRLGPQFLAFKSITVRDKGFKGKVQWTGNMVTFLDGVFKLLLFQRLSTEQRFLYPSAFKKFILDAHKFFNLEKGTELEVYYDNRSNILKCPGFQLEGLITSPDPAVCKPLPPLQWRKKTFVSFEDNKLELEQFLSASVQLLADQGLKRWRHKVTPLSVIEIQGTNETHSLLDKALAQVLASLPHISATVQKMELLQAKENFKPNNNESYLVLGSSESLLKLSETVGKLLTETVNCMFLAHVYPQQTAINGSSPFTPVLTLQVRPGEKLLLLNKRTDIKALRVLELTNDHWLKDLAHLFNGSDNGQPVAVVSPHFRHEELLPILATQKFAHRLRCVFLDKSADKFSLNSQQYRSLLSLGLSVSYVVNNKTGSHFVFDLNLFSGDRSDSVQRVIISSDPSLDVNTVSLNTTTYTYQPDDPPKKVELEVVDYCGTNESGERVMGVAQFDPLTNSITADSILSWVVPNPWSMEEAVTVPVAYSMAYYLMCEKTKLAAGNSVLIHIGCSPLGQACVAVSIQLEADVFVTVESKDQITQLLRDFPALKPEQVILVDHHVKAMKLKRKGKGVDLVINCLPDREVNNVAQCVGPYGSLMLLSEVDVRHRQDLGMGLFMNNTFTLGVSLKSILHADSETKFNIENFLRNGMKQAKVQPLKSQLFKLHNFSDALENLRKRCCYEKTVVIVKARGLKEIPSSNSSFLCDRDKTYVIIGSGGSLWLDLAEWLVQRGARKLLLAPASAHLSTNCCRRLDRLVSLCYLRVMLTSATRISSVEDTCKLLREAEYLGPVSAVFCVALEENSAAVSYLDKASRLVVPALPHFVCLLSGGVRECESRTQDGLQACVVLPDTSCSSLSCPEAVLPYLATVLTDGHHCYTFTDQLFSEDQSDKKVAEQKLSDYLPSSVADLIRLGEQVDQPPILEEVVTRSPPYEFVKHNVLPVFLIPGTDWQSLEPLYKRLMHPAYIVKPPLRPQTIQQTAQLLLEEVLKVQPHGPYNLVGESVGGAIALQLASLLGEQVEVFLLDAGPTLLQECVKSWTSETNTSVPVSLLSSLLPLKSNVVKRLAEVEDWDDQLTEALRHVQSQLRTTAENVCVEKALTYLKNHLTALTAYQPPKQLLRACVHLIRHKGATEFSCGGLEQYCQQKPKLHMTEEADHKGMMKSPTTATIINENLLYSWDF